MADVVRVKFNRTVAYRGRIVLPGVDTMVAEQDYARLLERDWIASDPSSTPQPVESPAPPSDATALPQHEFYKLGLDEATTAILIDSEYNSVDDLLGVDAETLQLISGIGAGRSKRIVEAVEQTSRHQEG